MGYWGDSNINFVKSLPIKVLTKGFLVKIVPEVLFISKQLSTSPPSVKKKRENKIISSYSYALYSDCTYNGKNSKSVARQSSLSMQALW